MAPSNILDWLLLNLHFLLTFPALIVAAVAVVVVGFLLYSLFRERRRDNLLERRQGK
jgi:heme/copper-type cytochrome/quinol oxidase subunit 2